MAEVWVESWWWVDRELLTLWVGDEQDFLTDVLCRGENYAEQIGA
ncbi:hypothetical protein OIE68_04690 [Nocardia vinacea]|nr:hypothetical protein OIE68_04690 [Nocardia vinacea]